MDIDFWVLATVCGQPILPNVCAMLSPPQSSDDDNIVSCDASSAGG